jgi:phospho-acceptor domain-containing protein
MEEWLENFARTAFQRSADTAHDLKTPLNVAVLNLELLRMRVAKLAEESGNEKIAAYAAAIETELRRMARIFDAFFLLSTPPKGEREPGLVDIAPILNEIGGVPIVGPAHVRAHESRIRQGVQLFFEGSSKVLDEQSRTISVERSAKQLHVLMSGRVSDSEIELTKIFKFYYTDPTGNPDLSLASARLIMETYGGELQVTRERDTVILRLTVPLGDQ